MGRNLKPQRDPRGHSLRIYSDLYDSPAFAALSPHDVLAYLALLRELKGYNNGDLSLPLTRAKQHGIGHHQTLARSLRALCAVGLLAITRKGGCTKGGQRLPNLYRLTDRECYAIPKKHLEAQSETNEWKRIATVDMALQAIADAEKQALEAHSKLKSLGHGVTETRTPHDSIKPLTTSRGDVWTNGLGHGVTLAKKTKNLASMRASAAFSGDAEIASHRTPRVSPIYIYQSIEDESRKHGQGSYQRLTAKPSKLFTNLMY
jgi:alkylhydroperoxidase/carboxymuconolactone decarboxylase family protein YurZ